MTAELAVLDLAIVAVGVLVYIAYEVRLFRRVLGAIVVEMQSSRWERGVRDSLAREALEKLVPGWRPAVVEDDEDEASAEPQEGKSP